MINRSRWCQGCKVTLKVNGVCPRCTDTAELSQESLDLQAQSKKKFNNALREVQLRLSNELETLK